MTLERWIEHHIYFVVGGGERRGGCALCCINDNDDDDDDDDGGGSRGRQRVQYLRSHAIFIELSQSPYCLRAGV